MKANDAEEELRIRLLRPANAQLIYTPQEAVDVMYNAPVKLEPKPNRQFLNNFKQKMIDDMKIPVQRSQLDNLLKAHGGPGKPYASSYW